MLRQSRDRLLHWLFEAGLAIKGLPTSLEAFAVAEHPDDTRASWTLRAVQQVPVPTQHFYALYLLAHGGLKLVLLLWRKVVWADPAAMVVLAGFVACQPYEFVHAGTPILLLLAVFDLVMIGLVWQEWKALSGRFAPAA